MTGGASMRLTDAEVHEAALKDPDAQPLSDAALARMKPVARARTLRRALGLTQEEFAARYRLPIGTLRDWEQGRAEPDQPARAYLTVIAHDPEGVRRALEARPAETTLDPCPGRLTCLQPRCLECRLLVLLGGGCERLMLCHHRPMRPEERADVAHCQGGLLRGGLPRVEAHL